LPAAKPDVTHRAFFMPAWTLQGTPLLEGSNAKKSVLNLQSFAIFCCFQAKKHVSFLFGNQK
jgi:hypothetical protein